MKIKNRTFNKLVGLTFISPWLIGFLLFTLYPFFQTIRFSFNKLTFNPSGIIYAYVGLENYINVLFKDPNFVLSIPNYLQQMFFIVPMVLIFSILLALVLNSNIKFRRGYRAIFFLPVIILSGSVLEQLTTMGAMEINGVENFFIYTFIKTSLPFALSAPILFVFNNIVVVLWFSGVQILIFLSGLQKMDKSVYEAAGVDGASSWQQFWKITLPTLKPFIFLNAMFTIVDISNSNLNPIIGIIKDGMFRLTMGFGFSSSATWIYFFLIVIVVLIYYWVLGRQEKEY